jgi:hypothetical protein
MRTLRIMLCALALGGCATFSVAAPRVRSDWDRTMGNARRDVDAGNYFAAQRLLDEFVRVHPDGPEAREIAFWKAVYTLDPANEQGSLAGGITALDQYLASTDSTGLYRSEARVLRRTAAAVKGVTAAGAGTASAAASPATPGQDTVMVTAKSRDEEIASLKDQLAKSKDELAKMSAELDRIKKRLANPSN